jgi:hypothetical protein
MRDSPALTTGGVVDAATALGQANTQIPLDDVMILLVGERRFFANSAGMN